MKGSFVHEQAIDELAGAFRRQRVRTARQVLVNHGGRKGFIDLVAYTPAGTIAVELERSPARVDRDLSKGMDIGAQRLWIVVPNRRVAIGVKSRLAALGVRENKFLSVFTIPEAIQAVTAFR